MSILFASQRISIYFKKNQLSYNLLVYSLPLWHIKANEKLVSLELIHSHLPVPGLGWTSSYIVNAFPPLSRLFGFTLPLVNSFSRSKKSLMGRASAVFYDSFGISNLCQEQLWLIHYCNAFSWFLLITFVSNSLGRTMTYPSIYVLSNNG